MSLEKIMTALYYPIPAITTVLEDGTINEHTVMLCSSKDPDLTLEYRVTLFGEAISRTYSISPPLPEIVLHNPDKLLEKLAAVLKVENFNKDLDLWLQQITLHRTSLSLPPVSRSEKLEMWEKMLHGVENKDRLVLDCNPENNEIDLRKFYGLG